MTADMALRSQDVVVLLKLAIMGEKRPLFEDRAGTSYVPLRGVHLD